MTARTPNKPPSLAEEFAEASTLYRGPDCSTHVLIESLPDEDAEALRAALANPAILGTTIGRILRDRGHNIGDDALRRHRKGECRCKALGRG